MLISKKSLIEKLTTFTEKETGTGKAYANCVARGLAKQKVDSFKVAKITLGDAFEALEKLRVGDTTSDGVKYDLLENGKKIELKFSTTRTMAHRVNPNQKVDMYRVLGMTKSKLNGVSIIVYDIPSQSEMLLDNSNKPYANQKVKYINKQLTEYYTKLMLK